MTNKFDHVVIVQTHLPFDREFPHWRCMGMGMRNRRLFQFGIGMNMRLLEYSQLIK